MKKRGDAIICYFFAQSDERAKLAFEECSSTRKFYRYGVPLKIYTGWADDAYKNSLKGWWDDESVKGDLVTIEQDIQITAATLRSFRKCKREWCTFSYQGPPECGFLYRSLGCAKFSASLRRRIPFDSFYAHGGTVQFGDDHWRNVDLNVIRFLCDELQMVPHVHGHVQHNHAYPVSRDDHPVNCLLYDSKDHVILICKELQLDRSVRVYKVNADGSRGEYLYDVPPMPKFAS